MHVEYDPKYHHLVMLSHDDEHHHITQFDETAIYGLYAKSQHGQLRVLRFDLNQPAFKPLLKAFSCFTNPIRKLRNYQVPDDSISIRSYPYFQALLLMSKAGVNRIHPEV